MLTVQITMEGGVIQDMQCPAGVRVVVHDYDVDGSEEDLREDEEGHKYVEGTIDPKIRVCRPCWQNIKRAPVSAFAAVGRALAKYNSY